VQSVPDPRQNMMSSSFAKAPTFNQDSGNSAGKQTNGAMINLLVGSHLGGDQQH